MAPLRSSLAAAPQQSVSGKLQKAEIVVLSGRNENKRYPVLFNPTEYTIERSNAYKSTAVPMLGSPILHFVNGEADQLSLELFLDDHAYPVPDRSVAKQIQEICDLMRIDQTLHAPPLVSFEWGELQFQAIIEKIGRKVTMFRPDGTPARASLSITFKQYTTLPQLLDDPRLESSDRSKRRVLTAADSLPMLAWREYGDVRHWRKIAEHNDLDDPREAIPGDWVMLPPLEQEASDASL